MRFLAAAVAALALSSAALAADVPTSAPELPAPQGYGKTRGVIPGLLIGPKLSLLTLPAPFGFGVEGKALGNLIGFSADYGYLPTLSVGDVEAGMSNWNLGAKVYPWRGRFFVGALFGGRSFEASATDRTSGTPLKASIEVSSTYLAPELGWRWVWNSGFFMGMEVGWQFVLSSDVTLTLPHASLGAVGADTIADVTDAGDTLGEAGLPQFGLLQLGWFF